MPELRLPSPLQLIADELTQQKKVTLLLKREDLIHPIISGNKWRKLKYNLEEARRQGKDTLLTFGGAYSNHIHATAYAAREYGFKSIGIIRGEELGADNPTLRDAQQWGMHLHFLSRAQYKEKEGEALLLQLLEQFGDCYIVPEGGKNEWGVKGCMEITEEMDLSYQYLCCPCGTGTTVAGLIASTIDQNITVLGFSALKGDFLVDEIKGLLELSGAGLPRHWKMAVDYHFGGYAKQSEELITFMEIFEQRHEIALDPVYTGKMMYGIYDLISKGFFPEGSTVVALHTGGLQGTRQ